MQKHLNILTLIFTLPCLVGAIINEMPLFTVCGWLTATFTSLNLVFGGINKAKKQDNYEK